MNTRDPSSVLFLLTAIVGAYVAIGVLYAALTPVWQVPDEPAHYNYIRALAEDHGLPVVEPGDYDRAYLERLTSERFPPGLSIEPLEYEDHQPPLYYVLATPIYLLFDGAVLPLRLLSVLFGAGLLMVVFGAVRAVLPARPALAPMATAFVAFIPQHVATTAGVNNDTLAELVVGGTLWTLAAYVGGGGDEDRPWPLGLLLAAALLTKTTAYVVVGVAVAAVVVRWRRERRTGAWAVRQLAWMLVPALVLSAPWFVRNGLTYGWRDPLGLARHDAVVEGQPRTFEWLAEYGGAGLVIRMARTTFHSFWGQFGWMAVPLSTRIYRALLVLCALLAAGFVAWLLRRHSLRRSPALLLLALSALLTCLSYVWYNLTFVQHQGRYLFPALVPLSTMAALGLDTLSVLLPGRTRSWALVVFFAGLAVFDLYCLFEIVVPNL